MSENDFKIGINDVSFFEKAGAEPGKTRRIGGIASIETKDRQKETLLQRGLDFTEFVNHGWFNDNHSRATDDVLGYPSGAKYFSKGEKLPNGNTAKASGHWVEGYLLNTKKANRIWDLAKDLQGTPRRLGFSVEGKIQKRDSLDKSVVSKAIVREVAITKSPVNTDAQMDILFKSLSDIHNKEELEKTLTVGTPTTPGEAIVGPKTGENAGQVLSEEDLEKKKKKVVKALSYGESFDWLSAKFPKATNKSLGKIIDLARTLKQTGKL